MYEEMIKLLFESLEVQHIKLNYLVQEQRLTNSILLKSNLTINKAKQEEAKVNDRYDKMNTSIDDVRSRYGR